LIRFTVNRAYTTPVTPSVSSNSATSDTDRVDTRFYRFNDGRSQPKHGYNSKRSKARK